MAKQPGTQLNSNAISPRLQINFPTRLSGVNAPLGGRLPFFPQKLEHDNKRSIHFGNSTRLPTRPCRNTFSNIYAQTSAFLKRNRASRQRNSRFARQKCHSSGATHPGTVYE